MSELKALHITDTHENPAVLEAVIEFVKDKQVDVLYHTGDFIGNGHNKLPNYEDKLVEYHEQNKHKKTSPESFLKENGIDPKTFSDGESLKQAFEELSDEKKEEFEQIQGNLQDYMKGIETIITDSINKELKPHLQELGQYIPRRLGVCGNHDPPPYFHSLLGNEMEFLDKSDVSSTTVTGKTGTEFVYKGIINSYEPTRSFQILQDYQELWENKVAGDSYENPRMFQPEIIKEAQKKEKQRLDDGKSIDVLLMHKDSEHPNYGTSELAKELHAGAKSTCTGHVHSPYVAVKQGVPIINPGSNGFAVIDYDNNKEIELITLYKIVYN